MIVCSWLLWVNSSPCFISSDPSDAAVAELSATDVIASPMYNFGVPSSLKAWIDHLVRPGVTFRYGANGAEGPIKGKKVI